MPNAQDTYEQLADHARETALLTSIEGLLGWDEETYLPPAGGPYRAEQHACLARLIHGRQTDPRLGDWLGELIESPLAADPHSEPGAVIRNLKRRYDKKVKLPAALVEEMARTASLAQQAWREARQADAFATFEPLLAKTVDLKRQEAEAVGYAQTPYDALLDDYEPGETTANVAAVLAELRERLTPLVQQIVDSGNRPPDVLSGRFPIAAQEAFGKQAAAAIGFDFDAGRLDVTAHPFCGGGGPRDVRLTTRYDEADFVSGFFSILHEAGHGIYEQGLPPELYGLPTGEAISLGIHESQSRMWENLVGRSRAFWEHLYPAYLEAFPGVDQDASLDDFCFAINRAEPSLIRVESDEATYNLHIIIRFELEQALLTGDLQVADLPAAWNDRYRDYLGVTPPSDADGVLQDVHWSAGLFGYFATYSLGNLYAVQFFDQAEEEIGPLAAPGDGAFARGEFAPLREWLNQKIHAVGQRYSASELVEQVTGKPLSCEPLMRQLSSKFGQYYGFA